MTQNDGGGRGGVRKGVGAGSGAGRVGQRKRWGPAESEVGYLQGN